MPTPFTHLLIAQELLEAHTLPPGVRRALSAERPAFLLGNIAPDVQTVSGQAREATHFFPVPLRNAPPAPKRLFERHPALASRAALPDAQAAFLAGYLTHLTFDQLWIADVFEPVFGEGQTWGTFRERLYLHNALRAYMDSTDLRQLPGSTAACLHTASPGSWLPFVADHDLRTWRDLVAHQLVSGAARTVEVFAARMGADPQGLAALLASPEEMERLIFARVPHGHLARYRVDGLERSAHVIRAYWG